MGVHDMAEAMSQLSDLIERAARGEEVIITRYGQPAAELRPFPRAPRPVTSAAVDWLATHRVGKSKPAEDAGALVSRLRDDESR
jgi:antitoxin (DNA-binding transcriptional repressor) of toxin-antitoxin stability system